MLATGLLGNMIQVRKDDILARSQNIPQQLQQQLRHAPVLKATHLFPSALLKEVDTMYKGNVSTKAFEQSIKVTTPRGDKQKTPQRATKPSESRGQHGTRQQAASR